MSEKYTDEQLHPKTFWQLNEATNLFEEIDPVTGAVVSVAGDLQYLARKAEFVEAIIDGQKVLVQSGVHYPSLDFKRQHTYSEAMSDVICQKIADGHAWTEIPSLPNFPTASTLRAWLRTHPEFADAVKEARQHRAESLRDEAMALARSSIAADKDEIAGRKLAIETMKWGAEKDNPTVYGNKVQVEGGVVVEMKLETGIRRAGDPGAPLITLDSTVKISPPVPEPADDYEVPETTTLNTIDEENDEPATEIKELDINAD